MHPNSQDINRFENNTMKTEETIAFLSHLEHCDFCLNELVSDKALTKNTPAPSYLKEQILTRAAQVDIQTVKAVKETSRKMQLFCYGFRTAAGVIAALFLLFTLESVDFSALSAREQTLSMETATVPAPEKPGKNYLNEFSAHLGRQLNKGSRAFSSGLNQITNLINGGN